jgi:hypothetical protein
MGIMAKEDTLYVRNGRPNRVVFHFNGMRYRLEHRGHRQDSTSLPIEAANDPEVSRWMKIGQLEKISKDAFMKLGARQVDVLPNEYLQRKIRNTAKGEVVMIPAEADATRSLTQINEKDIGKSANPAPKWAGELMSTDEEIETLDYSQAENQYPSKYRDDDQRREMGY